MNKSIAGWLKTGAELVMGLAAAMKAVPSAAATQTE